MAQEIFLVGVTLSCCCSLVCLDGAIDTINLIKSEPGKENDPALIPLDQARVKFVYLRKQGDETKEGDDLYLLKDLIVVLYGPTEPAKRIFRFFNGETPLSLKMANEHGLVVYLQEIREG